MTATKRLAMIAGEPSGDRLAAELMQALRRAVPDDLAFFGVGGPAMQEAGLRSAFAMDELSHMGLLDVVTVLPRIARRLNRLAGDVSQWRPDAVITVDSPEFSLRLQRRLAMLGCPRLHYVAPKAWAWRPGRVKRLARDVDAVLGLFPFETEFFANHGVVCEYVGHPALDLAKPRAPASDEAPVICLLPGSRRKEVLRHLPLLRDTALRMREETGELLVLVPTVEAVRETVESLLPADDPGFRVITDANSRWEAFASARMALAGLGTVTLELAFADCPFISLYRTDVISAALASRLIRCRYLALPNILLDRLLVPELIQNDLDSSGLYRATHRLWHGVEERLEQQAGFARLRRLMWLESGKRAADAAAEAVLRRL